MKEKIIAKRYAEAFMDYASGNVGLKKAAEEVSDLKYIFSQNPDLLEFLKNLNIKKNLFRLIISLFCMTG